MTLVAIGSITKRKLELGNMKMLSKERREFGAMKSPQEFEDEFFRLARMSPDEWNLNINELQFQLDYPAKYAKELILKWTIPTFQRGALIQVKAWDLSENPQRWKWSSEFEPPERLFGANHGAIVVSLRAEGQELAKKAKLGF